MRIRSLIISILAIAPLAGCQPSADELTARNAAPPPAAALAPLSSDNTVDQALELLERELNVALETRLDEAGAASIVRAEAITDRLLETRVPFDWIPDERYFVDSLIRQIQADADRILAQIQSGVPRDTVLAGLGALARQVTKLRADLARGGGRAPPPLERLLQDDTAAPNSAG